MPSNHYQGSSPAFSYNPGVQDRSGEIRAQGIMYGIDSIMHGVREYQQNKLVASQATARFEAAASQNPDMLQFLQSPNAPKGPASAFKKLANNGAASMQEAAMLSAFADSFQQEKMRKMQMDQNRFLMQQQQQNASALKNAFMSPMGNAIQQGASFEQLRGMPNQVSAGQALRNYIGAGGTPDSATSQMFNAALDSEMVQQARRSAPQPVVFSSQDELEKRYPKATFDYNFVPQQDGSVVIPDGKISPRSPAQPQPQVPNPLTTEIYKDFAKERSEVVMPALKSLNAYEEIDKLLTTEDGKIISGAFANAELMTKRIANALGAKHEDVKNTETLRALFAVPVAQVIKNFGAGTGLSDADREYAAKAAGGDITMNAETIKNLVRIGKKASENIAKGYEERLDETFPEDSDDPASQRIRKSLKVSKSMRQPAVKLPEGWSISN